MTARFCKLDVLNCFEPPLSLVALFALSPSIDPNTIVDLPVMNSGKEHLAASWCSI